MQYGQQVQDALDRLDASLAKLRDLVKRSLVRFKRTRETEGKTTKIDLERLVASMRKSIKSIKKMEKTNSKQTHKKLNRFNSKTKDLKGFSKF